MELSDYRLFSKYNRGVPRYTSYPAVPLWKGLSSSEVWLQSVKQTMAKQEASWGLYLHMPFCESLCTFCGCTKIITSDHGREAPYVETLLKELDLYLAEVPELKTRPLRFLHLGGGSPSFFSARSLDGLVSGLATRLNMTGYEGSIEVDPRRTSFELLRVLGGLGFRRISLGVQDTNSEVQRLVNRHQPFELVIELTEEARRLGYDSLNFDLIYGLPKQTTQSIRETAESVMQLQPDRIAFYSLAHVPWIKPSQRLFADSDLAQGYEKWILYREARNLFKDYIAIGMDHFAKPEDALAKAKLEGRLHRNFMGYTEQKTDLLLALGMSGISESSTCFHQNAKDIKDYQSAVAAGSIATIHGHELSLAEAKSRRQILDLMTHFACDLTADQKENSGLMDALGIMQADGLLLLQGHWLQVTGPGESFVRVIASELDPMLASLDKSRPLFSKAL